MKETLRGCPQRSPGPAPPSLRVGPVSAWHCRPSAPGTSSSVSRRAGPLARRSSCVCKNIYLPLCSKGVFAGRSILGRRVFASFGPARPLRWPRRVPQHPLPPSLWLQDPTLLFLWLLLRLLSLSLVLSSLIKVRFGVSFCVLSFVCLSLYFLTGLPRTSWDGEFAVFVTRGTSWAIIPSTFFCPWFSLSFGSSS